MYKQYNFNAYLHRFTFEKFSSPTFVVKILGAVDTRQQLTTNLE